MSETTFGPDLADILEATGSLKLDEPQTADDLQAALETALAAVHQAYRVAYAHANGDREDDAVDSLDLAASTIADLIA